MERPDTMLEDFNLPGIINYLDEAKKFISSKYVPADNTNDQVKLTTAEIFEGLTKVIPKSELLHQDVYEIMIELGFEPKWTPKETIREIENEDSPTEVDEENRMDFIWCLKIRTL
ncbi:hypothetical protein [Empedobacter brevis]|uniref:hypothetical protein n=1 Tax=Empedobacter brevis TaxID=247 RepID=UPI0028D7D9AB|nr:hypothetical protein [Empedobacter brevis]